jgi:hypothetical protein
MSGRKNVSVSRTYKPDADACLLALTILLKKPVTIEGSPALATLDNDTKESKNDCAVTEHYT